MYWTQNATFVKVVIWDLCWHQWCYMLCMCEIHFCTVWEHACNTIWDTVLNDQSTKHAMYICWQADMQLTIVFRLLCKSWLINTQGWLSSILNYKGQKYAITQNILYVSIQSVVYLHVFRLKKDGLNFLICADCWFFYYKQAWMLLLFFLMANTVKGFSTWILWQKRLPTSHL